MTALPLKGVTWFGQSAMLSGICHLPVFNSPIVQSSPTMQAFWGALLLVICLLRLFNLTEGRSEALIFQLSSALHEI